MARRRWVLVLVGITAVSGNTGRVQSQTGSPEYDQAAVKSLSKRIDQHLSRVWNKAGVTPAPKAEDHVFFRRLNLDLTGRIPELSPIYDFVDPTNDSPEKRWLWVDKLLEGPEHPRHFANVWRNVILGSQTNQQFQFLVPQFETWLRERVEKNVALDKIVQQLLTSQQNNGNVAFGGGNNQFAGSPQLFFVASENKPENLAGVTSRVFLGVKIECAQCHAHPFAKWKKDQFWEFAAFFSAPPPVARQPGIVGALTMQQPKLKFQPGKEILIPGTDQLVKAKYLTGDDPKWDGVDTSRKTLSNWITASDNPYFARAMADHLWSYLMGVSLLEPIMEPSDDSPITHSELLDDLARGLVDSHFDPKFLIRAIVHSDAYQRSSGGTKLADKEDYQLFLRMPIRALSPEQIFDSVAVATQYDNPAPPMSNQPFFNPNQLQTPRAQFLAKFMSQDRRHEPQTSILQALFMMNGKFMSERTRLENNKDLQTLSAAKYAGGHEARVASLYRLVLSRPARPEEVTRLARYLSDGEVRGSLSEAVSDVYWALLNCSEFLHNH